MSASVTTTNKRHRSDPIADASTSTRTTTPFEASKCKVISALGNMPTLQESQHSYFLEAHQEFIKLKKQIKNFESRSKLMDDDNHTIRSAKFKFTLNASDLLLGDNATVVTELQSTIDDKILLLQNDIKLQLKRLIDEEIEAHKKALQLAFAQFVIASSASLAILDRTVPQKSFADVYRIVFDLDAETAAIALKNVYLANTDQLYDLIHSMQDHDTNPEFAAPPATQSQSQSQTEVLITGAWRTPLHQHIYAVTENSNCVNTFARLIRLIYDESWKTWLDQNHQAQASRDVAKFLSATRAVTSSKQTAMDIDQLAVPGNNTLSDVVNRAVSEKTSKLQRQIKTLQHQLSKNSRGASATSASLKKKKVHFKLQNGKADAADKDSFKKNPKGKYKKNKKNTKRNLKK